MNHSSRLQATGAGSHMDNTVSLVPAFAGSSHVSKDPEPAPGAPHVPPIDADHRRLWEHVLAAQAKVSDPQDVSSSSKHSISNDLESQSDSDEDVQPVDNPEFPLNPTTYGIPPGVRLQE